MSDDAVDAAAILERIGFDPEQSVLTRRQAEVLALRERGLAQSAIAERLGTSRANVSSVESSARRNVALARETVALAEALEAPVAVHVEPGTDVYEIPDMVYEACDDADIKVGASRPEVIATVSDAAGDALDGRQVVESLTVAATPDGELRIRTA